jgi:L-iditol 2-dehydrogenase
MPQKMKVLAITGKETIEIREVDRPVPRPNQVLVKIEGCAICTWEQRVYASGKATMPFLGGHEVVGRIVELGSKVNPKDFALGDLVTVSMIHACGSCYYCRRGEENLCVNAYANMSEDYGMNGPGGFAQYKAADPSKVWKLNPELPWENGIFVEPLGCVCKSIERANIGLGDDVVVIGGGVMGMLHLLTAKRRGARVIMSEIDPRRRELAESFGCDVVFSPKETDPVEFVKKLTEGRGADVVFDTTAFPAVAAQAIEMTGKMGRCIMYSSIHPDDPLAVSANMLHNTERVITGSVSPSIASFDTAVRLLNKKLVDPSKLLSAVIPFEDAKKAFETAIRPDTYRVIIKF